jgi:hypothetical protein
MANNIHSLDEFKQALDAGWRPKDDSITIQQGVNVTWFPQNDLIIVPTDKGAYALDDIDLKSAREYNLNLRRQNATNR